MNTCFTFVKSDVSLQKMANTFGVGQILGPLQKLFLAFV